VRVRFTRVLAGAARVVIPVNRSELTGAQGSSSETVSHAGLALDLAPFGVGSRVVPFVGVTAGGLWLHASGVANAPYTSQAGDAFAATLGLRAGAAVRLTPALSLRAEVDTIGALPRPAVYFAGRAAGALAEPLPEATLGLELAAW
jgi:hypothetical protein